MQVYDKYILPKLINWACRQNPAMRQRSKIVPAACGQVLEVGIGSGLNLGFYRKGQVKSLIGIDPSAATWRENKTDLEQLPFTFQYLQAPAEAIPLDDQCIDTIVITYSMCTIPDLEQAFAEFRRVLRPHGQLLFCEHGKAPDAAVAKWQDWINPVWKRFGGGCNLNRNIPAIIRENGFKIEKLDCMYLPGWKPATFNYWGKAIL